MSSKFTFFIEEETAKFCKTERKDLFIECDHISVWNAGHTHTDEGIIISFNSNEHDGVELQCSPAAAKALVQAITNVVFKEAYGEQ